METLNEKQLIIARTEFNKFLAVDGKNLGKLNLKTPPSFFKTKINTNFESLACVGYNPEFKELTATVRIKKSTGYFGNLCTKGSTEYVRFYVDYQDGNGWNDVGYVAVNVHDIPNKKDCDEKNQKPIDYVVRLAINPKIPLCTKPILPKVKAVLSWNSIPAENDPDLTLGTYLWSDVKEENIQIKPIKLQLPEIPNLVNLLEIAVLNPDVSFNNIAINYPQSTEILKKAKEQLKNSKIDFTELAGAYQHEKVESHRFGYKLLKEAEISNNLSVIKNINSLFELNKIPFADSFSMLQELTCNTDYEELHCVGADYNREALVGTFKIKRPLGYNGDSCTDGSKEYVSFWIQKEESCTWIHAGTTFVNVQDIKEIPDHGLSYSVILPYDFSNLKEPCNDPQVLKVRAVLSWNQPPEEMDCSGWGNVVESYIQLKPSIDWDKKNPKLITIGGVATDKINSITGLTVPGAKIEFNQKSTFDKSPFGGIIVIQGISAPLEGKKYKVKITNDTTKESYYLNSELALLGYDKDTGKVTHNKEIPINNEYTYRKLEDNTSNILARFTPGTNDLLTITIEHSDESKDSHNIQMDNTVPQLMLDIDDNGNCSHYPKGGTVTGKFTINETHLHAYAITTDLGDYKKTGGDLGQSGTVSGYGEFKISASDDKNCGSITLQATEKTIWNSAWTGKSSKLRKTVCLS
ncbi:hypothetical protein ATE84_2854 [Aquimarina sp. MAR_2010_214]|uniref:hypothetical protein n=1 Tax=Aquimarina sp. MAR_2010_214 TaxID=1250026 RepID=UPI000C7089BC|nr:hypothetical protein [Aquimarina sp. MAR_2010_214]PKV50787.1 hypothetical protein ATE84_2854 [Aquimarina sp. MAR_2010_214]